MKFSPDVFESLQSKLKVGNRRGVHLNAIPGNSRYKFDISRLSAIKKSLPELFVLDLLTMRDVKFTFSTQSKAEHVAAKESIYLNDYDDHKDAPPEIDEEREVSLKKIVTSIENLIFQNEVIESEKGMNTLGFGFPILIRRDSNDNQISASPLLIWTIRIKATAAMNTFEVSRSEDDPIYLNEVLVNHLQSDSGVFLDPISAEMLEDGKIDKPELLLICKNILEQLQTNQDLDFLLDNYAPIPVIKTKATYEKLLPKKGDTLIEKSGIFSLFEVQKQNIINDYADLITSYKLNETVPDGLFQSITSIETDPSQQNILESLKTNSKIVIQGPPGTGKSQTLTALLINALENHQKTIVVCEKQTALEVLQNALQQRGLGDFCTMIKDSVADRRGLVDRVRTKIDAPTFKQHKEVYPRSVVQELLNGIHQNKNSINQVHHKLNEEVINEQDWAEIIGRILALQAEKQELDLANLSFQFTTSELDAFLTVIEKGETLFENFKPFKEQSFFTAQKIIASNRFEIEQNLKTSFQEYADKLHGIANKVLDYRSFYFTKRKEEFAAQLTDLEKAIHAIIVTTSTLDKNADVFNSEKTDGLLYRFLAFFSSAKKKVLSAQHNLQSNTSTIKSISLHPNFPEISLSTDLWQNVKNAENYVSQIHLAKAEFATKIEEDFAQLDLLHFYDANYQTEDLKVIVEQTQNLKQQINQENWTSKNITTDGFPQIIQEADQLISEFKTASQQPFVASYDWHLFYYSLSEKEQEFVQLLYPISKWQSSFLYSYYNLILLKNTDGTLHVNEENYANFAKKIKSFESTQKSYIESYWNNQQLLSAQKFEKNHPEISVANLFNKRKSTKFNRLTLRQIANKDTDLFTTFFPILLTTPDACSNLFQGKNFYFDNVVFDEASQLKLEDNLPAMLKGKNIIIAGDEHQMPPSNYFSKVFDGALEEEDESEEESESINQKNAILGIESLLDFAMEFKFDKNYLDFHYRSKHPYLIDFSNHAFYGSRLKPLPSSNQAKPIEFYEVDGVFNDYINEAEADKIIEVLNQIEALPNGKYPSVGIATFNITQRNFIKRKIIQKQNDPDQTAFNEKILALEQAGLFIKNLENIQGDERDMIIISTTYGKKKDGKFIQAFGPINQSKGYKLLNVIITRAKEKIVVITSIPTDYFGNYKEALEKEGANNRRAVFYAYLNYCKAVSDENEAKRKEILRDLITFSHSKPTEEKESKKLFKEQIFNQFKVKFLDYDFELNHPFGGYTIDILIKIPNGKSIALECLSKETYQGELAYLEDLHKEKILKNSGFEYARIWSQNWWQNSEREIKKWEDTYIR
ncbi:AAA domain-containing protein [Flavobacterium tegetincola]|uniref:AAA domain-containing protein n=1 Tax=Flavobacterium tegetincola TaxID=150172 RepID=UPI000423B215|nr:AAA domain-containing protein [Flavobacterium tegetincola]